MELNFVLKIFLQRFKKLEFSKTNFDAAFVTDRPIERDMTETVNYIERISC